MLTESVEDLMAHHHRTEMLVMLIMCTLADYPIMH